MKSTKRPPVIVIAGPTASGKSVLALELAAALGGTIVNADSQQIYRDLPILTAQPDAPAMRRVPHRLYGFLDASERGSVVRWRVAALMEIAAADGCASLPVVVGGTGMYLRALLQGLAPVPLIPPEIRTEATGLYRVLGGEGFRQRLAALDPEAAARLSPSDRTRLTRAWEVVRATGRPLSDWQKRTDDAAPYRFATILMMPPRDVLYPACDARFAAMIAAGALDEAAALAARFLDPELPAMKALGVPELLSHLRGKISLAEAVATAQRSTRRYAKRQMTWFRHQITADHVFVEQFSESLLRRSRHFIDQFLLTARE
jgi:tRNA dimethylallyltransferase